MQSNSNITTVFLSSTEWENVSPHAGSISEPYRISVEPPSQQGENVLVCIISPSNWCLAATLTILSNAFPDNYSENDLSPYNPNLKSLYNHFVETVYNVCSPFTTDPKELAYIAGARWPGYVSPILEEWKADNGKAFQRPSEDVRIRLTKLFMTSITNAVEYLYPRLSSESEWRAANSPLEGLRLSQTTAGQQPLPTVTARGKEGAVTSPDLPRLSYFILIAAFLASYNPAKTDVRMFAKDADDKKRRKRKGGSPMKKKQGSTAKVIFVVQSPARRPDAPSYRFLSCS